MAFGRAWRPATAEGLALLIGVTRPTGEMATLIVSVG